MRKSDIFRCSSILAAMCLTGFVSLSTVAGKGVSTKENGHVLQESSKGGGPSSGTSARGLGLPLLNGLTSGLNLGGRKRRAISSINKVTNKKPTDKDSACKCPAKFDPICGSNGITYTNKCMFQCEVKKIKSKNTSTKKPGKNSKIINKFPSLKVVKKGVCDAASSSTTTVSPESAVNQTVTEMTDTLLEEITQQLPPADIMPSTSTAFDERKQKPRS